MRGHALTCKRSKFIPISRREDDPQTDWAFAEFSLPQLRAFILAFYVCICCDCVSPKSPQLCRSADFSERPLPFNADLQAKFLGMTTNNDRYPFLTLAKVSRFSDAAQGRETDLLEKDSKAN